MSEQGQMEKLQNKLSDVEDLCDKLRQCLQIVECYVSLLMMTTKQGVVEAKYLSRVKAQIAKMGELASTIMAAAHTEASEAGKQHSIHDTTKWDNIKLPTLLDILEGRDIEVKEQTKCKERS